MTELEILRRRRELVVLSAELQRATLARRLDRVERHPAQVALGLASSVMTSAVKYLAVLKAFPVPKFFNR